MDTPNPRGPEIDLATEVFLDAFLTLVDGKDDDDLIFVEGPLRAIAEQLNIVADLPEIEPMTAGEFRARFRASKSALANGEGPRG